MARNCSGGGSNASLGGVTSLLAGQLVGPTTLLVAAAAAGQLEATDNSGEKLPALTTTAKSADEFVAAADGKRPALVRLVEEFNRNLLFLLLFDTGYLEIIVR